FTLADGTQVAVARDWRRDRGAAIKAAYKAACGIFGTTLGPGSDGHHEDHLHFDTAEHRNGAYCR
ncbi:MAG TPA: extensin family protein, partial [Paracoccaceae bacterium]